MVSLEDLLQQALRIHDLYGELNLQERGRVWTQEEFMLGFVGDVGDLAKLVMAEAGAREMPGGRTALEHELADCLWSVLILAHRYDIDLEAAFRRTGFDNSCWPHMATWVLEVVATPDPRGCCDDQAAAEAEEARTRAVGGQA